MWYDSFITKDDDRYDIFRLVFKRWTGIVKADDIEHLELDDLLEFVPKDQAVDRGLIRVFWKVYVKR